MSKYTVVARMAASFYIPLGTRLRLAVGDALVQFYSTTTEAAGQRVPRPELTAEIILDAQSLSEALNGAAAALLAPAHVLSWIANAYVSFPEIELGFDSTPGLHERDFFQRRLVPTCEVGTLIPGRKLDSHTAGPVHAALAASSEPHRLLAGINHYANALSWWRPGLETLALAHLWMAVENLTGVVLRAHLAREKMSEEELMSAWALRERRDLRPAVRERIIFRGDDAIYAAAKRASDGFEHGFLDFRTIRSLAQQTHVTAAGYIRTAMFEMLDALDEQTRSTLLGKNFERPRGPLLLDKYFWGSLVGEGQTLAAPGEEYPRLEWTEAISKVEEGRGGTWGVAFNETMTVRTGQGIEMKGKRHEVWDASIAQMRQPSNTVPNE